MRDWGSNSTVMRTLDDARRVMLGKSGRVPERCIFQVVESTTLPCARCNGDGVHKAYKNAGYDVHCRTCDGAGEITTVEKRRRLGLGVYERKVACDTYIYETPEGFIEMRLRNTVIARWTPWWCEVFCEGWPTSLTRERLDDFTPANVHNMYPIWMHADGPLVPDGLPEFYIGDRSFEYYHVPGSTPGHRGEWRSREIDPGPFGENCWYVHAYQNDHLPRDWIIFFDGMKINEEGYCMNPPILSEQRALTRCVHNPGLEVRKWARRLLKAARAGGLGECERCHDLLASDLPNDGDVVDGGEARSHVVRHVMHDELVPIPILVQYMAANGKGNVNDFARFVDTHLTAHLTQELKAKLKYNSRPGGGWQSGSRW